MSQTSAPALVAQALAFQPQIADVSGVSLSAAPSAVLYQNVLYVLHQQSGDKGWLWFATSSNGQTWSPDQQVHNVGMSESPAGVVFKEGNKEKLFAFHQGRGKDGKLWYTNYDGAYWGADRQIGGVGMSYSPGAAVFRNRLYVFHHGSREGGELWYTSSSDGINWAADQRIPNVGITDSPSAAVYRDELYVFHQGKGKDGALWYTKFNGSNWSADQRISNVAMSASPGAVVYFDGMLYVFHQGSKEDGKLLFTAFDGSRWTADQLVSGSQIMSWSPAAIDFQGNLEAFFQGKGKNGKLVQCLVDVAEIVDVVYHLDRAKETQQTLRLIYSDVHANRNGSEPDDKTFSFTAQVGQTSHFENSVTTGITLERGRSFEAKIPVIEVTAGGERKMGLSKSQTWTYGQEESFSVTYANSTTVKVYPNTEVTYTATVSTCVLDVPYTMILRARNGNTANCEGQWDGLTSFGMKTETKKTDL